MRVKPGIVLVTLVSGIGLDAEAGGKRFYRANSPPPPRMVTPNGTVVPSWATRRLENATVPLFAPASGRRPWAYALSMENTPSARWAAASQLGIGAGPIPGFTNGPPLGNYPQAAVGLSDPPVPPHRNPFFGFPFPGYAGGLYP